MSRDLAQRLFAACHLEGEFRLRSGELSREYFDKYRFEAQPALLLEIAERAAVLIPPDTQVLAGLATAPAASPRAPKWPGAAR